MQTKRIKLWDLPTRLFHWLLATLVIAAIITAKIGGNAIEWHGKIGLSVVSLLAFRIVWGFAGSTYARFSSFLPTPAKIRAYLRGNWFGVGHNPLGALSVLGLLALLTIQVGTGLFANDDIAFSGPLISLIGKDLSDRLTGIHALASNVLIALIALHLAAIAFYAHVKKDNLIKPMLSGWKEIEHKEGNSVQSASGGGLLAFVAALLIGLGVYFAASGIWIASPPAPASSAGTATPAW